MKPRFWINGLQSLQGQSLRIHFFILVLKTFKDSVNFVVEFSAMEHPHKRAIAEVRINKSFHYSSFLT